MPVLKVDDNEILFESAVINEFIDEVTPGTLKPSDPLTIANNRAWIEYGGTCLAHLYMIADHDDEPKMRKQISECTHRLQRVEDILGDSTYFEWRRTRTNRCSICTVTDSFRLPKRKTKSFRLGLFS